MRSLGSLVFALVLACLAAGGCGKPKNTESPTTGTLSLVSAEAVAPVIQKEIAEFMRLYIKAAITCDSSTSREALVKFVNLETKMVVLSRDLNPEEKKSLDAAKFSYSSFALAKTGIAVVVNPENSVEKLNLVQLRDIYTGRITRWEEVGGAGGKITPVSLSRNSGTAEVFLGALGINAGLSPDLRVVAASRDLENAISADPSAIGFVSMNWLSGKVKAVAVARDSSGDFIDVHQASVYQGSYPLVETAYALTTAGAYGLASGLISFMTSAPGQKIFLDSGLVPVTMPVKLIQLN
jgi:phosphate transport system substrate-binding protein